jgi:hypothetical protein
VRPTAHGSINETRYQEGQAISLEGEIMSNVSQADVYNEFRAITAPMIQTLDTGPALLKWIESLPDPREGLTNVIWGPYGITGFSGAGTITITQESDLLTNVGSQPFPTCNTALKGVTTVNGQRAYWLNAVTNGEGLSFSVWVNVTSLTATNVIARIRDQGDAIVASSAAITVAGGGWQVLTVTTTATSSAGWRFAVEQTGTGGATFYATGWTVVRGTSIAAAPFDLATDWTDPNYPGATTQVFRGGKQRLVKLDSDVSPVLQEAAAILRYQAQFWADDPRAYSQALTVSVGAKLSALGGGLKMPFTFPFKFTNSAGGVVTFYNAGNRPTPPRFRIYGLAQNFSIVNLDDPTGPQIVVNGFVQPGDYLDIDAATRTLTLTSNGISTKVTNWIDPATTRWFDFKPGLNRMQVIASSFDLGTVAYAYGRAACA